MPTTFQALPRPGWPVVLADGPVVLRPYRRTDAAAWSAVRRANRQWLAPWEPAGVGAWDDLHSPAAFRIFHRELRRSARQGTALPFAITLREPPAPAAPGDPLPALGAGPASADRYVGHISLANITRRALAAGHVGYWIDSAVAGRGIVPTALALLTDHAFSGARLHRVQVDIRPENEASRRVVEKLGFREEAYYRRYMFIDGAWRDHVGYALTVEDVAAEGGLLARWRRARGAAG